MNFDNLTSKGESANLLKYNWHHRELEVPKMQASPPTVNPNYLPSKDACSKREDADLLKYNWYHGEVPEKHAEIVLLGGGHGNKFLVRKTDAGLILSKTIRGWISHNVIKQSPAGYHLEGKRLVCKTLPGLIQHYRQFPINEGEKQVLQFAADSGLYKGQHGH